jgi:hypothetical protein
LMHILMVKSILLNLAMAGLVQLKFSMVDKTANKLPKFAVKSAAGTNTHRALPNNVRICPLAKR